MINQVKDPVMNQSGNHGTSFRGFVAHMVCLQGPLIFTSPLCAAVALSGSLVAASFVVSVHWCQKCWTHIHNYIRIYIYIYSMYIYIYIPIYIYISYALEVHHHFRNGGILLDDDKPLI